MMTPQTGRMLKEDGSAVNIADLIGGTETGETWEIDKMMPKSGRFVKEDGSVVNLADVIENFLSGGGSGGGGTVTLQALKITVDDVTYTYDGKKAVTIPIKTAAKEPLKIVIGDESFIYTGEEAMNITIPAVKENKNLNLTIGGQKYSYNGSEEINISVDPAEGVSF